MDYRAVPPYLCGPLPWAVSKRKAPPSSPSEYQGTAHSSETESLRDNVFCVYCWDHLEHESPYLNLLFLKGFTSMSPLSLNSHQLTDWCWWECFLQYSVCNLDGGACHCSKKGTIKCDADRRKVRSSLETITYSVSFPVGQGTSEPDTATWLIYGPNLIKLLTKLKVKWKPAHLQDLGCKH